MVPPVGEPAALALALADGDGLAALGEGLGLMLLRPSSPARGVPLVPPVRSSDRLAAWSERSGA
jgi:hypothetical protein